MAERSGDRLPDGYFRVDPSHMTVSVNPYPQLVWLWVWYEGDWSVTGSGVLIADDVVLTCAHIFAFGGAAYQQVMRVRAFPGFNRQLDSGREPDGGRYVETVYICGSAFPDERRQQEVDTAWDLAVVCLGARVPVRTTPPFVMSAEPFLGYDPAFKGKLSDLMTAGYGGPAGVIIEARMPVVEAFEELHWLGTDLAPCPGQSGAPIFYLNRSLSGAPEYRLVGVVSADDRNAPDRTIAAMITDTTEAWIRSAQETDRKFKTLAGQHMSRLLVRLHYPG
jgi:hypothetical protein